MIKDRLAELKAAHPSDDLAVTFENESNDALTAFYREVEDLNNTIDSITRDVKEMDHLHSDILSAPRADEKTKQRLEDLTSEIRRNATKVRNRLKIMEQEIEKMENKNSATYRIKKTQQSTLEHAIIAIMTEYNNQQNDYSKSCKKRIKRQLEITGRKVTDEEMEEMLEQGNPAVFTQGIETDTQQMRQTLADIEAQHADIMKLEKSIMEVHALFMDMASMIESQGDKIDSIENHVSGARDYIERAKEEMKEARKYDVAARKKKLILYAIIAVIIIVILLAVIIPLT